MNKVIQKIEAERQAAHEARLKEAFGGKLPKNMPKLPSLRYEVEDFRPFSVLFGKG